MRFADKRVLVTGAGHGIGLATARAFLAQGARVVLNDVDGERLRAAVAELDSDRATGIRADVSRPDEAVGMVETAVRTAGGLDIVVSNAGIYPSHRFLDMSFADFQRVMEINVAGTFLVCQAAARAMVAAQQGGCIVTISSGSAQFARIGAAHYCASKAAVVMLTRTMALELATHRNRVNSVAPGIIAVPGGPPLTPAYQQAMTALVPWGRMGTPEDVAVAVLLVAEPGAEYLTGQVIPVDGGLSAGRYGIPISG